MKTGIEYIAAERQRQIDKEGYSAAHDDFHGCGELTDAAIVYADCASSQVRGATPDELEEFYVDGDADPQWPWSEDAPKLNGDPIRNLAKAGALIAAEIDRILRYRVTNNEVIPAVSDAQLSLDGAL